MTKLPTNRATILVIDDEAMLCAVISRVLTEAGYRVLSFTDGQAALEALQSQAKEIDCILLDLLMPKLSGEAVLTAIRALMYNIPVVLMSGGGDGNLLRNREADRALSFLAKPFSMVQLCAAIEQTQTQSTLQM